MTTTPTIDIDATNEQLRRHLDRGGDFRFIQSFGSDGYGKSVWSSTDKPLRSVATLDGVRNVFWGVNPTYCTVTDQDRENNPGKTDKQIEPNVASKESTVSAVNAIYAEFDAKDETSPTPDEIGAQYAVVLAKKQEELTDGKIKTLPLESSLQIAALSQAKAVKLLTDISHYKALALQRVQSLRVKPGVLVDSGGGYQAYWLLADPYIIDSDDKRKSIKWIQAAWVEFVGADKGAKDLRRILRVPGLRNIKNAYGPNFPVVSYITADLDSTYSIADLEAALPPRPAIEPRQQKAGALTAQRNGNGYNGNSPAAAFNAAHKIADVLLDCGYTWVGDRMAKPGGKRASVTIYEDDNRSYHYGGEDPLNTGHRIDPFEAFSYYKHGGDKSEAGKDVRRMLGMGRDRNEFYKANGNPLGLMDDAQQTGADLIADVQTAAKGIDPDTGEILDDGTAHVNGHSSATATQGAKLRMAPGRRIKHTKDGVTRIVRIKGINDALTVDGGPNVYDAEYADDAGAWWSITVSDDDEIALMTAEAPKVAPAAPKPMTWDEIAREIARITATYETPEERQTHIVDEMSAHIAACERSKHTLLITALQMANAGFTKTDASRFIDNCVRDAKKAAKEKPQKSETQAAADAGINTWPYGIEDGCIVEYWTDDEGEVQHSKLCNFNAWIVADVAVDDGEGITRKIVIGGKLANGTPLSETTIKADEFESMQWVVGSWGARASIAPGKGAKDTLRHAIQTLSANNMQQRNSRAHTGWAVIDGKRFFVHNAGAVGNDGVSVELPHQLHGYRFPTDNAIDTVEAMRESIKTMDIANAKISAPLWASMYLAPLSEFIAPVFTISVEGGSGSLKSSYSAVMLNHYGAKFEENKTMPADWLGTANSLEKLCHHAKDVPLVIDDLRPTSSPAEHKELMAKVNHIVRAVGNRQGRSRLDSNSDFKRTYAPRGVVIITAERKAMGKSTNSRILTLDVEPGDIDGGKLSVAQRQRHVYGYAMAGYIQWVADNWDALAVDLPSAVVDVRAKHSVDGQHKRLPNATAVLYVAFDTAMTYAIEIGAITEDEAAQRLDALQKALAGIAETQNEATEEEDPALKYITIIATLIAQEKAYILAKGDKANGKNIGTAFGERLGWYDSHNVYLLPGAYNAVCKYASTEGWIFPSDEPTLRKELARAGYITKSDAGKLTSNQRVPGEGKKIKPVTVISYAKFGEVLNAMGVDTP